MDKDITNMFKEKNKEDNISMDNNAIDNTNTIQQNIVQNVIE